ncbi:MAG TPA: hypothetical protein VD735_07925 [Candidatus Saccharimonadales bacterium]|nr:hypothetical protein [Candidatus Saccharimonadales bacterium]
MAKLLGNALTMTSVLFPDATGNATADRKHAALFPGGANIQYTPDVAACVGINPQDPEAPRKLAEAYRARHVGAVVPTFHGGRLGKLIQLRLDEDAIRQEFLEQGMTGEVHVELARTDFQATDPARVATSIHEGTALMRGTSLRGLPLERTLSDLRAANWQGNTLVELTIGGVMAILQSRRLQVTKHNIIAAYTDINGHLKELLLAPVHTPGSTSPL